MSNPAELLKQHRDEILRLSRQHGACEVRVFGSVARGDAAPGSDLDLLVSLEPGRNLLDLGGLLMTLQRLLGCRVDVMTEASLRGPVRERALREAIPL